MPSSSDRDRESKNDPPKSENPFIRFRQFADAQVGSFLQGLIGLPSAFSRKPADGAQWDAFDDELRRRDELQARQKELKDALTRNPHPHEGEIPVKKSADWKSASARQEQATDAGQDLSIDGTRDVPLYSPVTKWLFAHLQQPEDPNVDWQRKDQISSTGENQPRFTLKVIPGHISSDIMRMTQYGIYNELNASPTFRSNYSILPYLMFSPYSPLRLSAYSQIQGTNRDQFPYLDAFEDLLRCEQQSPPPPTIFGLPLTHFRSHLNVATAGTLGIVPNNMAWISSLYSSGLLQEKEERTALHISQIPPFARVTSLGSETEQDMYENFLRQVTPHATRAEQSLVETILQQFDEENGSFPSQGLRAADEIIKALSNRNGQSAEELTDFTKELKQLWESFSNLEKGAEKEQNDLEPKQNRDPDHVTSTSTTTRRTLHDDGSVETSVTVRKIFADGRSTTTTTEHFEEHGERDFWDDDDEVGQKSAENNERTERKNETKKPNRWFWS